MQDLRYAARTLRKTPLFAASAILLLALGIGANTAIFSAIDETLFRPLNFPHPEQLADLFTFNKSTQTFLSTSYPDYQDLRARAHSFQQLSAFLRMPLNINWNGTNQRLQVECVTPNFFSMLRLQPIAGRAFSETDNASVALISEDLAAAIGQKILIEDQPFTIIGTMPKNYRGTNLNWGNAPQVWIPLQATETVRPRFRTLDIFRQRDMRLLLVSGRLKPGVTVDRAQAEIQTLASSLAITEPSTNRDITEKVFSASRAKFWPAYRASITRLLEAFAIAAGLVLLLTCANLSNLLLSRAVTRSREFAIRLAVGATRPRLIRQLLTENLLLVLPGSVLALFIAHELSRILARFPNALGLSLTLDGGLNTRVLLFSLLLSAATTLLFGLAPALTATRTVSSKPTLQNSLIVLQLAFSMLLLVGGSLFLHSVLHAASINFGFQSQGLLTAEFSDHPPGSPSEAQLRIAQQRLTNQLSAALADTTPFSQINVQAQIRANGQKATANRYTVSSAFFETIGLPLLAGRGFTPRDMPSSPAVAIVSQKLAARLWPNENPIGRFLTLKEKPRQVIGIVRDSIYGSIWLGSQAGPQPALYLPASQSDYPASVLLIRNTTPATLIATWNNLHPPSALFNVQTSTELLNTALAPQRAAAGIFGAFGLLSLLVAGLGLYSITAFTVARRTREIGIRIAIGAQPSAVVRQLLGKFMTVALTGIALGTTVSLLLARFLTTQVKGISVYDTAAFALSALLLTTIALLAAALPARRAARIEPHQALRSE